MATQCLNPDCLVVNAETHRFCQKCGQKLWLKDRYQALKLIGQGGFGKTFLAIDHDKPSKPRCVIKQFFPQSQGTGALQKAAELFAEEAKRLDELGKHPQIPELLAYFIHEDQRQYLVQEYIEGENLEQELKSLGVFNEAKIRALLMDLLPVLGFIHQRGVIHRDIKPENIIRRRVANSSLIQGGKKADLVLIDFGAAKQVTTTVVSSQGTTIGSFGYVPIEQMQGGEAYRASDLYSLGATCFHLLSGIHPWELWKIQGYGWVGSWRQHLPQSVSEELGQILDKLLQQDYQQRYQGSSVLSVLNLLNNQLETLAELR
jgi:serine/threonine protein kinase